MNEYTITNRWTGAVLYTGGGETLRDLVVAAVNSGADLRSADLSGADLRSADLSGANLRGADLSSADLRSADLRSADLSGADLRGADLRGANLSNAYLNGANLSSADLRSADLNGKKLIGNRPVLQIGPIGSRADHLVAYLTNAGVVIRAGCFEGSITEFRAACAETHGDSIHGREYAAAVQMIEAHAALWTEQPQESAA